MDQPDRSSAAPDGRVRVAEVVAALSLATDLAMGQPLEQAWRTCLLAVEAGRETGLTGPALADVYYLALLRYIGCTADAHEQALLTGGDEIAYYAAVAPIVAAGAPDYLSFLARGFARGAPPLTRARLIAGQLASGERDARRSIALHCEVARMLAARIGLPESVTAPLGDLFERWDGKGLPGARAGAAIALPARIVTVARDVEIWHRRGGWGAVAAVVRQRRGTAHDPAVVDLFLARGQSWLAASADEPLREAVLAAEPAPWLDAAGDRLDEMLTAFAAFADLKSPFTLGHSEGVAALVAAAARHAGMSDAETTRLRRAALVHDLGRAGIPNGIWDKPGPLSYAEWERVRLHPYLSERVLLSTPALAPLAALAGAHHERIDGSGYHRGSPAALLSPAARLLAAADVYQALTQPRPHRPALTPAAAAAHLAAEAARGRLDGGSVRCVLAAAGHAPGRGRIWPAGLSDREVEVLRLIARGASYKQAANRLSISPRTVEHHVEHIYAKIGVSSRAAAALFAMQHRLLDP